MELVGLGAQVDKENIIEQVIEWYNQAPLALQFDFKTCKYERLIEFHDSLGREIRNEFRLWENAWVPEIVDGADVSKDHPDQISMNIIEEVWRRINAL